VFDPTDHLNTGERKMASDSGQKFIKRNRPPRVQISYEDPYDAEKQVELPFVMGVMSDLSGNASKVEKPAMAERKFSNVDMDNFDDYMESVEPAATFRVDNKLGEEDDEKMGINLTFKKMEDFEPAAIARQVPALDALLTAREQLSNLQRYMDGKVAAEDTLKELLNDPELMKALKKRRDDSVEAKSDDEEDSS
jgi:type VI secretion system protein ImpB